MADYEKTTATKRGSALAEAQSLGIDTSGMSTREAIAATKETRAAQSDMADFINKVLDSRPAAAPAGDIAPAVATTRTTEDPSSTVMRSGGKGGGMTGGGVPTEFYTWVEGKVGKVIVLCQSGPSPL